VKRILLFAAICIGAIAVPVGYFTHTHAGVASPATRTGAPTELRGERAVAAALRVPHMFFTNTSVGPNYHDLAIVPADRLRGPRVVVPLECDRVDFRGGHGICLHTNRGFLTTYTALILDNKLHVLHRRSLPGAPSRARMSPDGRLAAYTVFVSGDSYAAVGFSTRTAIVDAATGKRLADLEKFTVIQDGREIHRADFNFWGVTFAQDSDHFYATLGTQGHTYLVGGAILTHTVRVLRDGVECPSISPDNTRIAFKQRVRHGSRIAWRPAILDIKTMRSRLLPETRNVDDQIAWLDSNHVAYGLQVAGTGTTNLWSVNVDGSERRVLRLRGAWSPSLGS
jgi:WD40-like Beta Propeller Repeat